MNVNSPKNNINNNLSFGIFGKKPNNQKTDSGKSWGDPNRWDCHKNTGINDGFGKTYETVSNLAEKGAKGLYWLWNKPGKDRRAFDKMTYKAKSLMPKPFSRLGGDLVDAGVSLIPEYEVDQEAPFTARAKSLLYKKLKRWGKGLHDPEIDTRIKLKALKDATGESVIFKNVAPLRFDEVIREVYTNPALMDVREMIETKTLPAIEVALRNPGILKDPKSKVTQGYNAGITALSDIYKIKVRGDAIKPILNIPLNSDFNPAKDPIEFLKKPKRALARRLMKNPDLVPKHIKEKNAHFLERGDDEYIRRCIEDIASEEFKLQNESIAQMRENSLESLTQEDANQLYSLLNKAAQTNRAGLIKPELTELDGAIKFDKSGKFVLPEDQQKQLTERAKEEAEFLNSLVGEPENENDRRLGLGRLNYYYNPLMNGTDKDGNSIDGWKDLITDAWKLDNLPQDVLEAQGLGQPETSAVVDNVEENIDMSSLNLDPDQPETRIIIRTPDFFK